MFKQLINNLRQPPEPLLPQQGKRLLKEESTNNEPFFTIKGTGRPGFFIIFGSIFTVPPTAIGLMILFGTSNPDEDGIGLFGLLFILPFIVFGIASFLIGLFLWLGKTTIEFGQSVVSVRRELFGKAFQQKNIARAALNLCFEESHQDNDIPQYKLTFHEEGTKHKIGVGGSLEEPELLWLEREVRLALGEDAEEIDTHSSVIEAISTGEAEDIMQTTIDPYYRSKNLRFTPIFGGWKAQSHPSIGGAIFMILIGAIFVVVGMLMIAEPREFLLNFVPKIREIFASASTSGGDPPLFFALIFGGMGFLVILISLFLLGYRVQISNRDSRLHIQRRWLVFSIRSNHQLSEFTKLEITQNGHVNNIPRYRLTGSLKEGKQRMILGSATAKDAGQLYARLKEIMPNIQ